MNRNFFWHKTKLPREHLTALSLLAMRVEANSGKMGGYEKRTWHAHAIATSLQEYAEAIQGPYRHVIEPMEIVEEYERIMQKGVKNFKPMGENLVHHSVTTVMTERKEREPELEAALIRHYRETGEIKEGDDEKQRLEEILVANSAQKFVREKPGYHSIPHFENAIEFMEKHRDSLDIQGFGMHSIDAIVDELEKAIEVLKGN